MKIPRWFYFLILLQSVCVFIIMRFNDYFNKSEYKFLMGIGVLSPIFVAALYAAQIERIYDRINFIALISLLVAPNVVLSAVLGVMLRP
jgi:hypothetical protein